MLKGEKKGTLQWKEKMQVPGEAMSTSMAKEFLPGNMVTDARSLYDHLCKTGNLPTERQVLLDLLSAKELEEAGITRIKWVPSHHQPADPLTKAMTKSVVQQIIQSNQYNLVQTKAQQQLEDHKAGLR